MINQSILSIERSLATEVSNISITGGASGVPTGGIAGQILAKQSNNNYDTHWIDQQVSTSAEFLLQTVYNGAGTTINKGEAVYITGAEGTTIVVGKAIASLTNSSEVIGVAFEDILNNEYGSIVIHGVIDGLNTNGFSQGDRLYLSIATYGQITNVQPSAPDQAALIGYCVKKDAVDGSIYVNVNAGEHLDSLHDVSITSATSGQYLFFDNDGIWKNKIIEYTDVSGLTGILSGLYPSSNPSGYITGDLSTLYPRNNPSGFITGVDTSNFYTNDNPSGFITGIENLVYTTGDQTISGRKQFSEGLDAGLQVGISTLYIGSGLVGINNEDPQASFDVSGSVLFSQRPTVNTTGVMLSGDIDISNFYTNDNPSGFITGIDNVVYTTGDQTISGVKIFIQGFEVGSGFADSSTLYVSSSGTVGINNEDPQASLDVSGSVLFSQRPTVNGTGVMLSGDINTADFYLNNNPSGYITGIKNLVYTTGNQDISGIKTFNDELYVRYSGTQVAVLHVESGKVGINNENPQAGLDVSGSVLFSQRPTVNGTGVLISGDLSDLYPRSNPSGYISGIQNLVYTTGDQAISGIKTFANNVTILGDFSVSGTTFINQVIDVTTTGIISGVTGVFQYLEAGNILYSQTSSYVVAQPGDDLVAKYAEATALTPNGSVKSATNRASLVIMPGIYTTSSQFNIDTDFVDVIGVGAQVQKPVVFIPRGLNVSAADVRVSGVSVGNSQFSIFNSNISQIFENCVGGALSFGALASNGTFINCVAGMMSFGPFGTANGTFINCAAGINSFGNSSAGGIFNNCVAGNDSFANGVLGSAAGTFNECKGGDRNFAFFGKANGVFTNCTAGNYSFAGMAGPLEGLFIFCRLTAGTFNTLTAPTSGKALMINCIDGNGNIINGQAPL